MPSTFFGLTIASSAMNAFQAAANTTANNISNVRTDGYTKQVANRQAAEALRVYQRFGMAGSGVVTTSITSLRNTYYDTKYWENQSSVGRYDTRLSYLNQIENYYIDDGAANPGFSTLFVNMVNSLDSVSSNDADGSKRKDFINQANIFSSYFQNVANGLSKLQKDLNDEIKTQVDSVNSAAAKIAALTKQINMIELQGGTANELRDQRALVIDELSQIVPITAEESPVTNSNYPDMYVGGTNYIVRLDGEVLVNTFEYRTLSCVSREYKVNQTDADGLYDVIWADTGMKFNINAKSMNGTLKGLLEMRDGNNAENFQGTVQEVSVNAVKIRPTTMLTVDAMTMAAEGIITIKNRQYNYKDFSVELNDDGTVASYTFQLAERLDVAQMGELQGKQAKIGDTIDTMGIPYYMSQMSEFLRSFASRINACQKEGTDLNGDPMGAFFVATKYDGTEYDFADQTVSKDGVTDGAASKITSQSNSYYQLTALNFAVADASIRDSKVFATTTKEMVDAGKWDAYDIVDTMKDMVKNARMFRGGTAGDFLECIYSDIAINTKESEIFLENYTEIQSSITNQRMSVSGVDEDEEALDLLKFQNAYNLAARMIQCMSEMYDKLINETGV